VRSSNSPSGCAKQPTETPQSKPASEPKGLARRTNLLDTESVKSYLANAELSENRKTKLLEDVSRFYAYLKIPFNRPRYKRIETLPFIPLESEIDQLIAGVGQKSAAFLNSFLENASRTRAMFDSSSRARISIELSLSTW